MQDSGLKTLLEVEIEHIKKALKESSSMVGAAKALGISYRGLYEKMARLKIPNPDYKTGRRIKNTDGRRESLITPRIFQREMSYWIDPKERDYYYNLDYLCGTYHGDKRRIYNKDSIMPEHGLGYGVDDDQR